MNTLKTIEAPVHIPHELIDFLSTREAPRASWQGVTSDVVAPPGLAATLALSFDQLYPVALRAPWCFIRAMNERAAYELYALASVYPERYLGSPSTTIYVHRHPLANPYGQVIYSITGLYSALHAQGLADEYVGKLRHWSRRSFFALSQQAVNLIWRASVRLPGESASQAFERGLEDALSLTYSDWDEHSEKVNEAIHLSGVAEALVLDRWTRAVCGLAGEPVPTDGFGGISGHRF